MSKVELEKLKRDFDRLDSNGDGLLSASEIINFMVDSDATFIGTKDGDWAKTEQTLIGNGCTDTWILKNRQNRI